MDSNPAFGRILNRIHLNYYPQNLVHGIVWQPAMRVNLRARLTRKSPGQAALCTPPMLQSPSTVAPQLTASNIGQSNYL
jgi:hypothetical protein